MKLKDESAELVMKYLLLIKMSTKNKNIAELAERCHTLISMPFIADQLKQMADENKVREDSQREDKYIRHLVCDEIREKAEYKNWSKAVPFVYVIKPDLLDRIEQGE